MSYFHQPISEEIWKIKYRYQRDDKVIDHSIEDTWQRVARAVAHAETAAQRKLWEQKFYALLEDFHFLPGGRILAGAGTVHKVTLFNCFVMDIAKDSLPGIFNALKEGALTLQEGGGVGYDFSVLRPRGQPATHSGSTASGPVSFMRIWNSMSMIMLSSGTRRGAMMGTLRCDHPDIEEFIEAKSDPTQLRQFNVSVVVTDDFMQAVAQDAKWALVFPVQAVNHSKGEIIQRRWSGNPNPVPCRVLRYVNARTLWNKIIHAAYDYAEPGVLFEDTINRMNPLWYREWISSTNPCGEIPLPAYGACDLGSINLTRFVIDAYAESARIDWQRLEATAELATRFLDNVISISKYPLKAQREMAMTTRRIGLGITGLADMFLMLGIRYGSEDSLKIAGQLMQVIAHATWNTSIALAKEKGVFLAFDKDQYLRGAFVKTLPEKIRNDIAQYGIRNSHHNTIAPTGTTSLLANNVSNGLEPIFGKVYERHMRAGEDQILKFQVIDHALQLWQKNKDPSSLPPAWVDAQSLSPEDHLSIQGALQPFIDNAISKTINLPEHFPFEKLNEIYTKAYQLGLKGCTIFRPNPITGSVMTSEEIDHCCPAK